MLDVETARKELLQKSLLHIEKATALTWASRAAAALDLAAGATTERKRGQWLQDAENYRQEALEHAAMTEDMEFLAAVITEIKTHRKAALKPLDKTA
ncbi:MAG: hypothetical protein AABX89_07280 [Candidatus Thermoplasmatota archaeon]